MNQKILTVAANPKTTPHLRLDQEVRAIDEGLKRSRNRDQFGLGSKWAVQTDDLRRALLDEEPCYVHFCGHGAGEEGILLEDELGYPKFVKAEALANLFKLFSNQIECVILNACYSEVQAEAISQHIEYVIGMKQAVGDQAAIKFTTGFYDAIGAGRTIEDAFEFGKNAIGLESLPGELIPVIKKKPPKMKLPSSELQANLVDYQQAIQAFKEILTEEDIAKIQKVIDRLEQRTISISAFGVTGSGKSALLNSLLGFNNDTPDDCPFKVDAQINEWSNAAAIRNGQRWRGIDDIELVIYDTPGIGGDLIEHQHIASEIANVSDVILFVSKDQVAQIYKPALDLILAASKPTIAVINQIDKLRDSEVVARKKHLLQNYPIKEDMIVLAAGHPAQGSPVIKELTQKIVSLIEAEGTALIEKTIEAELIKGSTSAKEILEERMRKAKERIEKERDQQKEKILADKENADNLIDVYAKAAAGAAAIIPIAADALTDAVISGGMLFHIAKTYDKKLDVGTAANLVKELITAFLSILFGSGATYAIWLSLSQAARSNPFTYMAGMAADGIFSYFVVKTIGSVFSVYCANDLSWGQEQNARKALRNYIKENIDKMFLDKLPKDIREKVKSLLKFDDISGG
jgi:GTPase SAR1 family protein